MRVLVAEDDPQLRAVVARMLAGMGHRVEMAADGGELLRLAASGGHDAVVSDIGLPVCDGLFAADHLKRARAALPVVLMSGDPASVLAARRAGFVAVLQKPFTVAELAAALAAASFRR